MSGMGATTFYPEDMTDDDLTAELIDAHGDMTTRQAAFVLSLAEFTRRGIFTSLGATSTIVWLGRRLNIGRSTAYSYVQVSLKVSQFPLISDAFLNGELTFSQVQVLCKHLTEANEYALLQLARRCSVRELELALAGMPDEDKKNGPGSEPEDRLEIWIAKNGRYRVEGDLAPALGAQLSAAIKLGELASLVDLAELDPDRLADDEELGSLLDEAEEMSVEDGVEVERVDAEGDAEGSSTEKAPTTSTTRFGPAGRSSVLSGFLGMMNLARSAKHSAQRAPGAQVHVVVTEDGHAFMPLNPEAPSESVVNLVNDAHVRGYLLDSRGVPLKMGRKRRLVTKSQEMALLVAWLFQCATPGCPHTRFLEFHHILGWAEGGATDVGNMIPLCSGCHALVTEGKIRIVEDPTDAHRLMFYFADGTVFVSRNRGLPMREETAAANDHAAGDAEDTEGTEGNEAAEVAESAGVADLGDWDENPDIGFGDFDDEEGDSEKSDNVDDTEGAEHGEDTGAEDSTADRASNPAPAAGGGEAKKRKKRSADVEMKKLGYLLDFDRSPVVDRGGSQRNGRPGNTDEAEDTPRHWLSPTVSSKSRRPDTDAAEFIKKLRRRRT